MTASSALNFSHPVFAPYQQQIAALTLTAGSPSLVALNALAAVNGLVNARNIPLRFVAPDKPLTARDYEQQILQTGCVPTRTDTWHDLMNALVWLRFTRFKSALNAAHVAAMAAETGPLRGRRRDALTMLDESGVWVLSKNPSLSSALRHREWQTLFWIQRATVIAQMQFVVVGHALLEKMLSPYPAITGKCLLLEAKPSGAGAIEALATAALPIISASDQFAPLPILGIPGWDPRNVNPAYYANSAVFRLRPEA